MYSIVVNALFIQIDWFAVDAAVDKVIVGKANTVMVPVNDKFAQGLSVFTV